MVRNSPSDVSRSVIAPRGSIACRPTARIRGALAALLIIGLAPTRQYCQELNSKPALIDEGVVVDSVLPALAGAKAGMRPGDLLLHWSRGERHGTVGSPFDLLYIMIEE